MKEGKPLFKSPELATSFAAKNVQDLMVPGSKVWNSHLIWNSFTKSSAESILSTHIPSTGGEDKLVWTKAEDGEATVKSVYKLLGAQQQETQGMVHNANFWKGLWSMEILPKWKVFLWRLINRALALNVNLCKRGILVHKNCHLCGKEEEDERHLFRDCVITKHIWRSSDLGISAEDARNISINNWIINFLTYIWKEDGPASPRANSFVATIWSIWIHRNSVVFKRSKPNPESIMEIIKEMYKANEEASVLRKKLSKGNKLKKDDQANPVAILVGDFNDTGIKLLVDGSWKQRKNGSSVAAVGWIIKHDQITLAKGGGRIRASSALQAEGYAILRGLIEAERRNIKKISTLSDSRTLCKLLKDNKIGTIEVASIMDEIRKYALKFEFCSIVNVSRNVVTPAHDLASQARKHGMVDFVI